MSFRVNGKTIAASATKMKAIMNAMFKNGMNANLVIGQPDFKSKNVWTTQSGLGLPEGVTFGLVIENVSNKAVFEQNLWVADANNSRVLVSLHSSSFESVK